MTKPLSFAEIAIRDRYWSQRGGLLPNIKRRLDPGVTRDRKFDTWNPSRVRYCFSDGSWLETYGRGINFRCYPAKGAST